MRDSECVEFLRWALPRLRMRWVGFRRVRGQLRKRIVRRLRGLGLRDLAAYRAYLEAHPDEWSRLDALCRIPISRFYRDRAVFEALREDVLPDLARLARADPTRSLWCWSAGCAAGEEAYTLEILWKACLRARFPDVHLRVIATDSDAKLLERARLGCFKASSLKELPDAWRARAFEPRGDAFRLRAEFRRGITFRRQDVRRERPAGPFHLVLCRNLVFTYFEDALQGELLDAIAARLVPGGALVIGSHESLPAASTVFAGWGPCRSIHRRKPGEEPAATAARGRSARARVRPPARASAPALLLAALLGACAACGELERPGGGGGLRSEPASDAGAGALESDAGRAASEADYAAARERMVSQQIEARGVEDEGVLAALRRVPRHEFVPEGWRSSAYEDGPLPIGQGQTISQPYVVAAMTELAALDAESRVLEVGTGSGYQAAVLAEIAAAVYTIEIVEELAAEAAQTLRRLGYGSVHVRHGDGYRGWPEAAPFDAILVTAGAPTVPRPLLEQLAPGGRLVIPVGVASQELQVHTRTPSGIAVQSVFPVRFVPMTGEVEEAPRRDPAER